MIREIVYSDFDGLFELYTQLHNNEIPLRDQKLEDLWNTITNDRNHHIIVCEKGGKIVSSCVCVIIPNLTHNQRPYAFIENVITHKDYRNKGLATACLDYAKEIALKENCYKMMLLTGSKKDSTLNFYRRAGYNSEDKTAFIQWL
ncbi:MAG: GNAT family N-acetyltransferase [Hominimerdicola sp.]